MDKYKELSRLIRNIKSGRFNHKRYRKRRKYYGLELHVDTEYVDGGYGMSIYMGDVFVNWLWKSNSQHCLNLGGYPHDKVLERMKSEMK